VIVSIVGVAPALLGFVSLAYGAVAALLGAGFVWHAWRVLRMDDADRAMRPAKALFAWSLLYLFAVFAAYLADVVIARMLAGG
jgi:protoheme IX farnesyltransferase